MAVAGVALLLTAMMLIGLTSNAPISMRLASLVLLVPAGFFAMLAWGFAHSAITGRRPQVPTGSTVSSAASTGVFDDLPLMQHSLTLAQATATALGSHGNNPPDFDAVVIAPWRSPQQVVRSTA